MTDDDAHSWRCASDAELIAYHRLYYEMQANGPRGDHQWIIDNILKEITARKIFSREPPATLH